MNLKEFQDNFDYIKWVDSMVAGEDKCGTYIFCGKCIKDELYPCARAAERFERKFVRIAVLRRRTK